MSRAVLYVTLSGSAVLAAGAFLLLHNRPVLNEPTTPSVAHRQHGPPDTNATDSNSPRFSSQDPKSLKKKRAPIDEPNESDEFKVQVREELAKLEKWEKSSGSATDTTIREFI